MRNYIAILVVLFVVTALAVAPVFFVSEAQRKGVGFANQTRSHQPGLENYDIRADKAAFRAVGEMRSRRGRSAVDVADLKDDIVRGGKALEKEVPGLKIGHNAELGTAEVIGIDPSHGKGRLASTDGQTRADRVKEFVGRHGTLFGLGREQSGELKVKADYENPEGGMSFVRLRQEINGVPVFAGEVRAGFNKNGDLVRVVNNLAAGVDGSAPAEFGDPSEALRIAAVDIGQPIGEMHGQAEKEGRVVFGEGDWAPSAERVYFPVEPGVVVPAWNVLIWQPANAYYVVVDVAGGMVLWRKNITEDQTQAATYNVWINPSAMINVADSPFPLTPGPTGRDGSQANALPRTQVTLVGNETPFDFNTNGWISDGGTTTDGNAVEAGLDRDGNTVGSNGVDANGRPIAANRTFDFPINPGIPTNPASNQGDAPLPIGSSPGTCAAVGASPAMIDYQRAVVTQLFYITNRYHDEMYRLGFTEAAGNFQHDNFGRGGLGNDRVSAEAQDCSGTNNANFGTGADGNRGRMQMYIFTNPTPDFDGSLDADIVIHELTHGLSNRLHGNAAGLTTNMSRGMGEGWSDFYAHAMLSQDGEDPMGVYTTGGYATYLLRSIGGGFHNYYYGIRRFPKALIASTGGPSNRPHNPLTFADIDSTQANINDGAFEPAFNNFDYDQVHRMGEVWSSMLWEVRGRYIERLGWEVGNRRILQHVTDAMKISPLNPTFIEARDAIVAAAQAGGSPEDVRDVWAGFAVRGMGASARITNPGNGANQTRVTQSFDMPNLRQPGITINDSITGDNDGYAEPGEQVRLTIPLENQSGVTATDVSLQIVGGGSLSYGSIAHNGAASNQFNFTIPASAGCGTVLNVTLNADSSLGPVSFTRKILVGVPNGAITENFDGVTAPLFPSGWTAAPAANVRTFVNSSASSDTAPNAAFAPNLTTGGETTLESPAYPIHVANATVSFRHSFDTERAWDGGVLEISLNGGAYQDIEMAGGSFLTGGYTAIINDSTGNPTELRPAWTGKSNGYITTTAVLPASAVGSNVRFRWRFGSDNSAGGAGWFVDSVKVVNAYTCSFGGGRRPVRGDFDGDRKTDFAVYRPSDGMWYVMGSVMGFTGYRWGAGADTPAPGDYDGDSRTDAAVARNEGGPKVFYVLQSGNGQYFAQHWGVTTDAPATGDYDGDRKSDISIYRSSDGGWWSSNSGGGYTGTTFGQAGDRHVTGDFDGDGRDDLTVFRDGAWITLNSNGGSITQTYWGVSTDKLVPADYDGDQRDDLAIVRDGVWWILRSSDGNYYSIPWGVASDVPVPGDYDGDGSADVAIYRDGQWWVLPSSGAPYYSMGFGVATDLPIPKFYLP